jgi:hypothetical protein
MRWLRGDIPSKCAIPPLLHPVLPLACGASGAAYSRSGAPGPDAPGAAVVSGGKSLAMLPFFPRDYLAATRHMSLAERGAYTDLLWLQWENGHLPNDVQFRSSRLYGRKFDQSSLKTGTAW